METVLTKYIDCYLNGNWRDDVAFESICPRRRCCSKESYCYAARLKSCPNKIRDDAFWEQYSYETDFNYYPESAFWIYGSARYLDKRVVSLLNVMQRPYFVGGDEMIRLMRSASITYIGKYPNADEAFDAALDEIASLNFNVSRRRCKTIMQSYFN